MTAIQNRFMTPVANNSIPDWGRWSHSDGQRIGSTVYFREPTVWERYSWQIASIVAVLLIQAGLISAPAK